MTTSSKSGVRSTLAVHVYEELETRILTGVYSPGTILKEGALAEDLGVSRTPVREAIRRLETEGLLREVFHGVEVLGLTTQDLFDIYEIRLRIEGLAARRAAENITAEQLQHLHEVLDLQEFFTIRGNADQVKNADSAFHEAIYNCCGSPILQDTLVGFHKRIQKYRKHSLQDREHADLVAEEHRRIYDALVAHDPDAAEQQAVQHVIHARERALGE